MLNIFSVQFRLTEVRLLNLARKIHILGPKKKDAVDPAFSTWTPCFPLITRVLRQTPFLQSPGPRTPDPVPRPRVFHLVGKKEKLRFERRRIQLKTEQELAVTVLLDGKDVLAVLPTGYGKSLIY